MEGCPAAESDERKVCPVCPFPCYGRLPSHRRLPCHCVREHKDPGPRATHRSSGVVVACRGLMEHRTADLPSAGHERPRWMLRGACRGEPIETFFTGRGGEAYDRARALCDRCPVRSDCAEYAIADPWIVGWWGGMSERERRRIRTGRAA